MIFFFLDGIHELNTDTVDISKCNSSCDVWCDMFWPNRLWYSHRLSPDRQTDPSVDWDLYACLS